MMIDTRKGRMSTVKLNHSTKAKLGSVRDALELAHRLAALPGVEPPKVSLAHTVSAALDLLMCVVSERVEVFEPQAVTGPHGPSWRDDWKRRSAAP